jgi:hypothetical protein
MGRGGSWGEVEGGDRFLEVVAFFSPLGRGMIKNYYIVS